MENANRSEWAEYKFPESLSLPRADSRLGRTQPEHPLEDYPDIPPNVQRSYTTNMAD